MLKDDKKRKVWHTDKEVETETDMDKRNFTWHSQDHVKDKVIQLRLLIYTNSFDVTPLLKVLQFDLTLTKTHHLGFKSASTWLTHRYDNRWHEKPSSFQIRHESSRPKTQNRTWPRLLLFHIRNDSLSSPKTTSNSKEKRGILIEADCKFRKYW